MKLYVVGAVTGKENDNLATFEDARNRLEHRGYEVVLPHDFVGPGTPWHVAMAESLLRFDAYDGIAVLPNSSQSAGASIEIKAAKKMGIPTMSVLGWEKRNPEVQA